MSDRSQVSRPSAARLALRWMLRQIGVHPNDRNAATLDLRGYRALCIATNHGVLDLGVATRRSRSEPFNSRAMHYGHLAPDVLAG